MKNTHHKFTVKNTSPTPGQAAELKTMATQLGIGEDAMNVKTLNAITRLFESKEFAQHMKREFDRSFDITVSEKDGKVRIAFVKQDTGNAVMTVADVAIFLQTDRAAVRRMTGERARRRSHHPIPFIKIGSKMIRFSRPAVEAWWATICESNGRNNASALTLTKGKVKKGTK
jgi:hypothetical protein